MSNKFIIPVKDYIQIEVDLLSFNRETTFSLFKITLNGFVKTEVMLTGETIAQIYKSAKMIINEQPLKD